MVPYPKIAETLRSYIVKEDDIGTAVSKILRNRLTDRNVQTSCYFYIRIITIKLFDIFSIIFEGKKCPIPLKYNPLII